MTTITSAPSVLVLKQSVFGPTGKMASLSYKTDLVLPVNGDGRFDYNLTAVIYHLGSDAKGGHWIAVVRSRDGTGWVKYDDSHVTVSPSPLEIPHDEQREACILVYTRQKVHGELPPDPSLRSASKPDSKPSDDGRLPPTRRLPVWSEAISDTEPDSKPSDDGRLPPTRRLPVWSEAISDTEPDSEPSDDGCSPPVRRRPRTVRSEAASDTESESISHRSPDNHTKGDLWLCSIANCGQSKHWAQRFHLH
jgi:hypothetical protein